MKNRLVVSLICLVLTQASYAQSATETVQKFIAAFNDKNIAVMLSLVAEDMKWMSVSGQLIATETANQEALQKAMKGYFKSIPSARSEIRTIHQTGNFVYALEQAFWTTNEAEKSQCSMAVYELAAGKIKHVWYFPAHACS